MSRRRKVILWTLAVFLGLVGWFAYRVVHLLNYGIPEAYAAWNTGTLLVDYMQHNDDRWPTSWDELKAWARTMPSTQPTRWPYGEQSVRQIEDLRDWVAIDWQFDPRHPDSQNPVTPIGGGTFEVLFEGTEPNETIREYLRTNASSRSASTRPTSARSDGTRP